MCACPKLPLPRTSLVDLLAVRACPKIPLPRTSQVDLLAVCACPKLPLPQSPFVNPHSSSLPGKKHMRKQHAPIRIYVLCFGFSFDS